MKKRVSKKRKRNGVNVEMFPKMKREDILVGEYFTYPIHMDPVPELVYFAIDNKNGHILHQRVIEGNYLIAVDNNGDIGYESPETQVVRVPRRFWKPKPLL